MNIRKLFEEIRSTDLFNTFWGYPEEKNLSVLANRISYIKSPRELRSAVAQICNQVFEENEEGSFRYIEAQNLLKQTEAVVERALATASITGVYAEGPQKEEKDTNKFIAWENAVIEKLCERYKETLISFTKNLRVFEVQQHIKIVLFGEPQSDFLAHNSNIE